MSTNKKEISTIAATLTAILITGLVNAAVAFFAGRSERGFYFERKKVEIGATAIVEFATYQEHWERLITYSEAVGQADIGSEQRNRILEYARHRDAAHDRLYSSLAQARFFFCPPVGEAIIEFIDWDEARSIETIDELPDPISWLQRFQPVSDSLRAEIRGESC